MDENLDPVYHAYVLPEKPVRDYATKWSGITPALLRGIQKRLCDVQQDIRKLLPPDAILVGHCLRGDLLALEVKGVKAFVLRILNLFNCCLSSRVVIPSIYYRFSRYL